MQIWHLTSDTPCTPRNPSSGDGVKLTIGTYPIEPGQTVWVACQAERADGTPREDTLPASWQFNQGNNSYWLASIGPFGDGDRVPESQDLQVL